MISKGNDISSREQLERIDVEKLYQIITNQEDNLCSFTQQIRKIKTISEVKYAEMKRMLPYFACALFNPSIRHSDHFTGTEYFVLDLDHITENSKKPEELFEKLKEDERVQLMFRSPGGDGLKVMFQLQERCTDAGKYKLFYANFAGTFALRYQLEDIIDFKTSDVARAQFICHDAAAYFNPLSQDININDYIDFENATEVRAAEKKIPKSGPKPGSGLSNEKIAAIKRLLYPNDQKLDNDPFVPEELDNMYEKIESKAREHKIKTKLIKNIQYGKQIGFYLDELYAEANLYYGKNGYRIVSSAKNKCNQEFNKLAKDLIKVVINDIRKLEEYSVEINEQKMETDASVGSTEVDLSSNELPVWQSSKTDTQEQKLPF